MATAIDFTKKLRPERRALVFNPGQRFETTLGGETFWFPASTETFVQMLREREQAHLFSAAELARMESLPPGVRPLVDRQTSLNGAERHNGNRPVIPFTVEQQLDLLLSESGRNGKMGEWGLRVLFEDATDAAVIKEATQALHKKERAHALAATAAHEAKVKKAEENGQPAPVPSEELLRLYRVLAETRRGGRSGKTCDVCRWPVENDAELAAHKTEFHAEDVIAAPAEVKRGPGRPRKVEAPEADV